MMYSNVCFILRMTQKHHTWQLKLTSLLTDCVTKCNKCLFGIHQAYYIYLYNTN